MCRTQSDGERPSGRARAVEFVDELVVSVTNRRIYSADHPQVGSSIDALVGSIEALLESRPGESVEIWSADGYLVFEKRPLLGASLSAPRIVQRLAELNAGGLVFSPGITKEELRILVEFLGDRSIAAEDAKIANQQLEARGGRNIRFLAVFSGELSASEALGRRSTAGTGPGGFEDPKLPQLSVPFTLYQSVVDKLQDVMVKVCRGEEFGIGETKDCIESILTQLDVDPKAMMNVCRYERYDAYTFGHSIRVCFLALNFARSLTRDQDLLQRIGSAALLHDVGKALVPFEVLHSQRRLTAEERIEMDKHAAHGGRILLETTDGDPLAVAAAFGHHRTLDHGGYPKTMHEARQSTVTKIVKICDVYEALTAARPYKSAMLPTRAYRIMLSMTEHFDLDLLHRFIRLNGVYPVGSRVRLEDGRLARIETMTDSLLQPIVVVDSTRDGDALPQTEWSTLDLSIQEGRDVVTVAELLQETQL